jgi:hypothetical protein
MIETWMIALAALLAGAAAFAIWRVQRGYVRKRGAQIEQYLRLQKAEGREEGRCSVNHLMSTLRMSRRQVLDACGQSPAIMRLATTAHFPGDIFADAPIFEYAPLRGRD